MTLEFTALAIYRRKLGEEKAQPSPGSLRMKARLQQRQEDKQDPKNKKEKQMGRYWLPGQPRPGHYSLTSINTASRQKRALDELAQLRYWQKLGGGPGSGVSEKNTIPICELPMSDLISIGKRKEFMEKNKPKGAQKVCLSRIKYVSQKNMVPKKVMKFVNCVEIRDKPIDVLEDSKKDLHVMDGHHRFLAKLHQGSDGIEANIYDGKPLEKEREKEANLQFKPPAKLTSQGLETQLRVQKNPKGHWTPPTMPKVKPTFDNEQYLKSYFWNNPYLG